jgi:hypothetical protein
MLGATTDLAAARFEIRFPKSRIGFAKRNDISVPASDFDRISNFGFRIFNPLCSASSRA